MSYLLTNASAMTALQNLTMTQNSLANTQEQLSTGLSVNSSEDNTSYWSIATTMGSDNGALGTVSAALTQNASLLSSFNSAITQAISVVNNIKDDLVSAQNTADPTKLAQIQTDISGQQNSLMQIVSGASYNGQNWLNGTVNGVSSTASNGAQGVESLVGNYTNSGGVGYISVAASAMNLVTSTSSSVTGVSGGILATTQSNASSANSGGYAVLGSGSIVALASTTAQSSIANMLESVNLTIASLETAAATVGDAQEQVTTQQTFVSSMQNNLANGVASLIDANMNQVSTRLQALQTQQQLGVQSLSIANQSSQMILKLFQ
jgi:flagellin